MRVLTAIPVYNEAAHLQSVLAEVKMYASDILVVDDGSTDRTPELLRRDSGRSHHSPSAQSGLRSGLAHGLSDHDR